MQNLMNNLKKIFVSIPGGFSIAISVTRFSHGYSWQDITYILGGMTISAFSLIMIQYFETKRTQLIVENNSNELHHIGTTISHLANKEFSPEQIIKACKPLIDNSQRISQLLETIKHSDKKES